MTIRPHLLRVYGLLLQLYPQAFRKRFAPEMLECAIAAGPGEWPLIFADTSLSIVRSWIEGDRPSTAMAAPNAYVPVGSATLRASRLFPGFALAILMIVGLSYINYLWPPPCPSSRKLITPLVDTGVRQPRLSVRAAAQN